MMDNEIFRLAFGDFIELIEKGICPFCNEFVNVSELEGEAELQEFLACGMCHTCYNTKRNNYLKIREKLIETYGEEGAKEQVMDNIVRRAKKKQREKKFRK